MADVSVIIPNYNQSKYIRTAIRSVLNQTYRDFEIIVVDDGSTDNSREVLAEFGNKVHYIWQANQGLAGARNTGIHASTREFIGLLDADDEWEPEYLEVMVSLARENPSAVVYYCMAQCMDEDGQDLPQLVGGPPAASSALYQKLLRANFIIPSTVLFRRKPVVDVGSFDANLRSCEDWDLWLRILPTTRIIGSSRRLVRYRVHGSSLSTNLERMHNASRQVIEKHFGCDDGEPSLWAADKRRAYGGLFRYRTLTLIQRQNDWNTAIESLSRAFAIDPTLAADLDLFYELTFGAQPPGYREVTHSLHLEQNAQLIINLLVKVFEKNPNLEFLQKKAIGIASYAISLAAYNTNRKNLSKQFLFRAFKFSPELLENPKVISMLLKLYLHPRLLNQLRQLKRHISLRVGGYLQ